MAAGAVSSSGASRAMAIHPCQGLAQRSSCGEEPWMVMYAGDGENGGDARVANGLYDVRRGQEGECEETDLDMTSDTMQWLCWNCAAWCCDPVRPPFWLDGASSLFLSTGRAACCCSASRTHGSRHHRPGGQSQMPIAMQIYAITLRREKHHVEHARSASECRRRAEVRAEG